MAKASTSKSTLVKSAIDALVSFHAELNQNINTLNNLQNNVTLTVISATITAIYYAEFREPQYKPYFYLLRVYLIGIFGLFINYYRSIVYNWMDKANQIEAKIANFTQQSDLYKLGHQPAYDLSVFLFNLFASFITLLLFYWSVYRVTDFAVNYWLQTLITYNIFILLVVNVLSLLHNIFKWRQLTK